MAGVTGGSSVEVKSPTPHAMFAAWHWLILFICGSIPPIRCPPGAITVKDLVAALQGRAHAGGGDHRHRQSVRRARIRDPLRRRGGAADHRLRGRHCARAARAAAATARCLGRSPEPDRLVLLAQNETGYRNLLALVSNSFLDGDGAARAGGCPRRSRCGERRADLPCGRLRKARSGGCSAKGRTKRPKLFSAS